MSDASDARAAEFLRISDQFKLGALMTETSHPLTANLSDVAARDAAEGLDLLFQVDEDVLRTYREFAASGRAEAIAARAVEALRGGGNLFFTGCGATGRLSIQLVSIWREFWRRKTSVNGAQWEQRARSVMAGGDFALIRSVEGFEDYAAFGRKQLRDAGVCDKDVVFAITEGGETSFVIGTAWQGVDAGAAVYFVYNNPDAILRTHVQRSREVIDDPRIEKINLTTGPMAITGSTRMQATSIQLCVMLTILEMVVRELNCASGSGLARAEVASVPKLFLEGLETMHRTLRSPETLRSLAKLVEMEESVYRRGGRNNYFAGAFGIDVLTDTTERSPTYCTPPFRKFDDPGAAESWAFLFVPCETTGEAWQRLLQRQAECVEWSEEEVRGLVEERQVERVMQTVRKIGTAELMRFRIGLDGLQFRPLGSGDSATAILSSGEAEAMEASGNFFSNQLKVAVEAGARVGLIEMRSEKESERNFPALLQNPLVLVTAPAPETGLLLDGVTRAGLKMLLNALSTCTMVRLGRVMGNCMIWVVASNLKLIDRATRYIQALCGLDYDAANRLLFEAVEYVEPRMKTDREYPPVVGLAVLRHREKLTWEAAEERLRQWRGA